VAYQRGVFAITRKQVAEARQDLRAQTAGLALSDSTTSRLQFKQRIL
jgi:hypothetical protein